MKPIFLFFTLFLLVSASLSAQKFVNRWQNVYGGAGREVLADIEPTKDGGFIMSGYSSSDISGTKAQNAYNKSNDYWLVKINSQGTVQWSKTLGGNGDDLNSSLLVTKDGGYLLGGTSLSDISANKSADTRDSSYDLWLVKLDSAGNVLWDKTLGGIATERMRSLAEGNGYYMVGASSGSDSGYEKRQNNIGSLTWSDYWMIKLSTSGQLLWNQSFGGTNQDMQAGFQICKDGGFYIAGYSYSPNGGKAKKRREEN